MDIITGEKCRQFSLNMKFVYWSVRSSSKRGGGIVILAIYHTSFTLKFVRVHGNLILHSSFNKPIDVKNIYNCRVSKLNK